MSFFSEKIEILAPLSAFGVTADLIWKDLPYPVEARKFAVDQPARCRTPEAFDLYFVSDISSPFGLYWHFHGHPKDGVLKTLKADVRRKPKSTVPPYISASHQRLLSLHGGFRGFLEALGKPTGPCDCEISFGIHSSKDLIIGPRRLTNLPFGFESNLQEISLSGPDGLKVCISHHKGAIGVEAQRTFELTLDDFCFDKAAETLWEDLKPILRSK